MDHWVIWMVAVLATAIGLLGHTGLWIGATNRLHGTGMDRWTMKAITLLWRLVLVGLPLVYVWWILVLDGLAVLSSASTGAGWRALDVAGKWAIGYWALCLVTALVFYPRWLADRLRRRPRFLQSTRRLLSISELVGASPVEGLWASQLARVPGNQLLKLEVADHTLEIARLPRELDGLKLVHLTDIHLSGRVTMPYYRQAIRLANELAPDLLLVTGDICEKAKFIPWAAEILAAAEARHGKFFVLGNHDLRTHDVPRLRAALVEIGFDDLGGVWRERSIHGVRVTFGGDEQPWHSQPLDPNGAGPRAAAELRLVLLHSPDRYAAAQAADADLALAGHTHGGQIRFPGIGAIICPSWYGLRYDCGLFAIDPALMYVGRGLCSLTPARFNCPPELTRLTLRAPTAGSRTA
jgi:predicted MPP superfamily phosphohydrolase